MNTDLILGPRCSGKTTHLRRFVDSALCEREDVAVIVPTLGMGDYWLTDPMLELEKRNVVSLRQVQNGALRGRRNVVGFIDNLDLLLAELLPFVDIHTMTMTSGGLISVLPAIERQ